MQHVSQIEYLKLYWPTVNISVYFQFCRHWKKNSDSTEGLSIKTKTLHVTHFQYQAKSEMSNHSPLAIPSWPTVRLHLISKIKNMQHNKLKMRVKCFLFFTVGCNVIPFLLLDGTENYTITIFKSGLIACDLHFCICTLDY